MSTISQWGVDSCLESGCYFRSWRKSPRYEKRFLKASPVPVWVPRPRSLQMKANQKTTSSASTRKNEDDVLRVLQELETRGLLNSSQSIYYKSDAFTYLNLYKQTAAEYGLQASLNNIQNDSSGQAFEGVVDDTEQQSTLNSYF